MRNPDIRITLCLLLSAILLSLPWLVPHCGFFALVGFVPLLWADELAERNKTRRFWLLVYLCFILWNAATTWWVKNATLGGAVFAVLANALQMTLVWSVFRLFRKRAGGVLPYIFLAAFWITWENWYLQKAQISWPWLVLGNAFAQSTRSIQWYEFTGTLGGSLWVWVSNLSIYFLLKAVFGGKWKEMQGAGKACLVLWTAGVLALPYAASAHIYHYYKEKSEAEVPVLIGQPDFDPYHKFESMSQAEQTAELLTLYEETLQGDSTWKGILIAPETFTNDVILNNIASGETFRTFQDFLDRYPGANLLFGASSYRIYPSGPKPDILAREFGNGWIMNYNTAVMTDTSGRADTFHKSKLVVGTELTPYPKLFVPLDNMLGGVMGRCKGQERISCVRYMQGGTSAMIGVPICYESVYGEYCTGYVNMGAKALAVITNDAWWGDTPGYKQHLSYSRLRAIETRRDIARCANTGISAIIDQRGEIVSHTAWWRKECLAGRINLNSSKTFFVRHGDIAGRLCTLLTLLFALLWLCLIVSRRRIILK